MNNIITLLIAELGSIILQWFMSDVGMVFVGLFAVLFVVNIMRNILNL